MRDRTTSRLLVRVAQCSAAVTQSSRRALRTLAGVAPNPHPGHISCLTA